ncbi:PREDICTED: DDB1- and CUL4-associated factor homolog 1-like [Lupinus angustifolius]|uniref:DDB1- and CUL4-associated factor homolog 1-like n=1 Tax=Lupinus angustifolius TaxID=3871 RepID=UPI00092E9796|nr:PREDICTED: DDB1- and CUL4-associated factor homolog 1-like [Lupinus angustifolius]
MENQTNHETSEQPNNEAELQEHDEEDDSKKEEEELVAKVNKLMDKITASPDNPKPTVLHALASILENQESRYMEENDHSSSSNGRAAHSIGRLGSIIRENDEFFELISSKFLLESRYSISVQVASARLLLCCSLTWIYPHVFEEPVIENIKDWVMDESAILSAEDQSMKHHPRKREASDSEMLKTYSTGLLAVCLIGGGQVVEDVLTSGLSAKLMRYLRLRVLGDTSSTQKDIGHSTESRHATGNSSLRGRDDGRSRFRHLIEASRLDDTRMIDERSLEEQIHERVPDRNIGEQNCPDNSWVGGEPPDGLGEDADICEVDADGEDRWHSLDARDGRVKYGEHDDNVNDSSRRRAKWARSRGKARVNESTIESEPVLSSPGSGSRLGQGRSVRDRSISRNSDARKVPDSKKTHVRATTETSLLEREDNDDCFQECQIGSKDISDLVRKAVRAAEAEARSAYAPEEAVKAAGDAAADLVKTAASEEFKSTNDEEAAVLAASRAVSTVIDAASAVELSRSSIGINSETENASCRETDSGEDLEDYFIPDTQSLSKLREKYCIQCLELLGEYVEVLGPVLLEKGVDVCLALLQQNSKHQEASKVALLLPDVMKMICALAAHRKFAALFVDRGGIQKLLAVPRMTQTFFGLSSTLFTIGSLQGIMERVCALPSDVVYHVVELALQLIDCDQDQARKNAALFFAAAFVFRAVLDAFDSQDGLQKLLGLLNDAALVRSGVNSGALGLSNTGSLRNDRSPAEVLTSSEKQIAYHTCVALRQYFRAHLLLLVDSIRPNKNNRSAARNIPSVRAVYKPLDISNEAIDAVFLQLQKDRKLGPAFVRTRWPPVEKFMASNGHITMLELCQAPSVERYLHDLLQFALGVLHIVTLVPSSRKMIVNTTLSNNRVAIAVILDAANIVGSHVDPEIIQPALNVLVNLVCPPPSISNKPTVVTQGQQFPSAQITNGPPSETRDRTAQSSQIDPRERNGETSAVDRGCAAIHSTQNVNNNPQTPGSTAASGLVGDRRISLGAGAGSAGLAAQLEQGYRQSREAVRSNNGIKVLLHLLQPRIYSPPAALDCLRALACRVLLGLARDDTIAQILTKLQVGKKLSELIRDSGSQTPGTEQGRWQAELSQAAIELIGIVTNSGRASTLAATDAATPTLRRIERAAIAAATPITYHARELLLLVHEHLQASGLSHTASMLLKEAQLTPLPSLIAPSSLAQQPNTQEASSIQIQWPSGRTAGFLTNKLKINARDEEPSLKIGTVSAKKKSLSFSASFGSHSRHQLVDSLQSPGRKCFGTVKESSETSIVGTPSESSVKHYIDAGSTKTPMFPMKRKLSDVKDIAMLSSSGKRLNVGDQGLRSPICSSAIRKSSLQTDAAGFFTPISNIRSQQNRCIADSVDDNQYNISNPGQMIPSCQVFNELQVNNTERITLDSLVVQYLKHQHRQCPAPITTLPPLSLLHPHVCPEPKRSLDAPSNVTARLGTREYKFMYGGVHGNRRDRQFVYSRFRPWRTCRDDAGDLFTCITFVGDSSHIAVGSHNGDLKFFDSNNSNVVESYTGHQNPLTLVQSFVSGDNQLLLSSSSQDVKLWDATSILNGPTHSFEGCKVARFSNSGNVFASLPSESARREILFYDVQTCQLESKLTDPLEASTGRSHVYSLIHFSPSDSMVLWNGVLWDRRVSGPVHRFEQLTDYGGGGFHPAGNEVIINSEVWDLRKFRLQRSVPSLDQTSITFNACGDVMYAILRRNLEDVMSTVHNARRCKHPLYSAFRTLDAINYSDIATTPVDRCVLDFASEPTDSFVGLVTMDDQDEMYASARIYEIGRRRPTDDDSDPDDAESEEEDDEDEDDDDIDVDPLLGPGFGGDSESDGDDMSNDEDDDDDDDDDDIISYIDGEEGDFLLDDVDFDGGNETLEIASGDEDDDDSQGYETLSSDEEDYINNRNRFGY